MDSRSLITVITTARRASLSEPEGQGAPASYLRETLESIDANGGKNVTRLLLHDSTVKTDGLSHEWTPVHLPGGPHGTRTMMWRALKAAYDVGADRLIYAEDDITLCKNGIEYLTEMKIYPKHGLITAFDPRHLPAGADQGLYEHDMRQFWCSQLIVFPSWSIQHLLRYDPHAFKGPQWAADNPKNSADSVAGHMLAESLYDLFGILIPCLAQHRGAVSTITPDQTGLGKGRLATNFKADFDAMSLPLVQKPRAILRSAF